LLEDIRKNQLNAELRVKLTQDQINSVQALLDTYGIKNLKVEEADMLGSFIIQGYVPDIAQWDKVNRYLSRDFPDIKNLIDQVETPETRKKLLENMLKERQLLGDVEIKLENGSISATTFLLPEDEKTWKSIIMRYNEATGGVPSILSKKADVSWLDIISLHIGDPSYIVLKDGKKYLEGTTLRGSIKLQQITEEGLIFETQRGRAVYSFSKNDDI
jgi:type III secretion system YscD/HrpQ family protein